MSDINTTALTPTDRVGEDVGRHLRAAFRQGVFWGQRNTAYGVGTAPEVAAADLFVETYPGLTAPSDPAGAGGDLVTEYRPDFGAKTREPSIRDVVGHYYRQWLRDRSEADDLTERYLVEINSLVASTPGQKGAGEEKTGACLTGYAEFTPISVRSSTGAPDSPSGHSRAEPSGLGASPEYPSRGLAAPYGIIDPDYARVFTIARCLAWQEGYALLMHGSFTRDLDLLAVPWGETPCEPEHLISRIQEAAGLRSATAEPSRKPHGRLTWTLLFDVFGDPRFVDIGVIASASGPGADGGLASAIAAEIMGLGWALPEFSGDEDEETEENTRRHEQVQSIVEAALRTLHAAGEVR